MLGEETLPTHASPSRLPNTIAHSSPDRRPALEETQHSSPSKSDDAPPTPGGAAALSSLLNLLGGGATSSAAHEQRIAAGRMQTRAKRQRVLDPSACVKCHQVKGQLGPVPGTLCTHKVMCTDCADAMSAVFCDDRELADNYRWRRCDQCRSSPPS